MALSSFLHSTLDKKVDPKFAEIEKLPSALLLVLKPQAHPSRRIRFIRQVRPNYDQCCRCRSRRCERLSFVSHKLGSEQVAEEFDQAEIADPTQDSRVHPSRSTVPRKGGKHHQPLVPSGGEGKGYTVEPQEYEETDALSLAPPRDGGDGVDVEIERMEKLRVHVEPEAPGGATIEDEKEA